MTGLVQRKEGALLRELLVASLWEQVGAPLWEAMDALEVAYEKGLKAGPVPELEAPLLEMIALLLELKLGSIRTEGL